MDEKELKIRFDEAVRIFGDSPTMTVTYADIKRVYEDMLSLLEIVNKKKMGFKT